MIVFDLACGTGHVFEAWFGSTDDYEGQKARGLVTCPLCGTATVEKAVMAPRVAPKGNSRAVTPAPPAKAGDAPPPAAIKAVLKAMAETQRRALQSSDYVGDRFASEARAIHVGESDKRSIHGVASESQVRGLIEDGIGVAPLPFPVRPPESEN